MKVKYNYYIEIINFSGSPARVMVYSKKEYLVREQDAPSAVPPNKHCRTMHDHYNAPPPFF
ncbi:hypothetical protein [Dapis sp. BLCC M229]|uniref:hypothetical protein n=1 Tax=Dapis sp. BLCC M229 TaxID=3400188 RepID=UPI003CFB1FFE